MYDDACIRLTQGSTMSMLLLLYAFNVAVVIFHLDVQRACPPVYEYVRRFFFLFRIFVSQVAFLC